MFTLKLQTGKAFTGASTKDTTLSIYEAGLTVAESYNLAVLDNHAKRMGFQFVAVKGMLFGGYYRNLQSDLYMAII